MKQITNKTQISLLALLAFIQLPLLADIHDRIEYKLNRILKDVEIIENEIESECTVITAKDFEDDNGVLSVTYAIVEPGKYCLGENIDFDPQDEFTPAIEILSDNVSLNLNGFTLRQAEGNSTANCYGVQIGQGYNYNDPDFVLKNVTIFNGNIIKFSAIGVFCYNGSFNAPTAQIPFQDLHFFDLNIYECGSSTNSFDYGSGISLDSAADIDPTIKDLPVAYKNVLIKNCNVNRCFGNGAIHIYTVDNVVVENTQANDLVNEVNNVGGIFAHIYFGRNIQMFNCQGNAVQDLDPAFGSVSGGLLSNNSLNVYLENCQFNDVYGEATYAILGALLSNNQNGIYKDCQFNNPTGGPTALIFVQGVHLSDGPFQTTNANGNKFINCQFNGARVSDQNPGGTPISILCGFWSLTNRNLVFENCQACNIISDSPGFKAYGFSPSIAPQDPSFPFADVYNITLVNCIASDISSARDTVGIQFLNANLNRTGNQGSIANLVVENCISERISNTSSASRVAGIAHTLTTLPSFGGTQLSRASNLFIRDCRVSDIRAGEDNPLSAGILVESVLRPVICNNSVSDCDRGILFTGTDDIIPNGFQLAATQEDALAFPPVFIDLNTIPAASPTQDFFNITQGNSVTIAPSTSTISTIRDFIFPAADLNTLGWESGDEIFYDCNGGNPISDLVCSTTYYAIVYSPGFTECGLVMQNKVDNCTISDYEDDRQDTTSAWVDNVAFNCGEYSHTQTYTIYFEGVRPVDEGTLAAYPAPGNKYYNLSLVGTAI